MINLFENMEPEKQSAIALISFIIGEISDLITALQILAFGVSILAGVATIYNLHRRWRAERRARKESENH